MPNSKNIKPSGKKFTFTDMTALLKPHLRAVFPGLRFPASISALERASYPAGRSPNSSFLFPPLAAVVAVALAELGCIAGAAPPPTRCLSNDLKRASVSPLRGNRQTCAVVPPSPAGKAPNKQKRLCRSRAVKIHLKQISAWRTGVHDVQPSDRTHLTLIQKDQYSCGFSGFPLSVNP